MSAERWPVYPSMLLFLCSPRRDQRVSVSTDGLCCREKEEGIAIYHTDCVNQQARFWWTAWNRAVGLTVLSPGKKKTLCCLRTSPKLIDHAFQKHNPPLLYTLLELFLGTARPGADANVQHDCEGIRDAASWCSLLHCMSCHVWWCVPLSHADLWPLLFLCLAKHSWIGPRLWLFSWTLSRARNWYE